MYYCNSRLVKHNDNFFRNNITRQKQKHKYHSVESQSEPIIVKYQKNR